MELTKDELSSLLALKDLPDSDNIRFKEIIKKTLINDKLIIYLLNNKELEDNDADATDYIGVNILPNYLIHPTQHNSQNFICYDLEVRDLNRFNKNLKMQRIIFYILCHHANNIEKNTGIARHDLIGSEILKLFNWTNLFGPQIYCVSDIASVTDSDYATRTITFEMETDNSLAKTYNGVTRMNYRSISAKEP